MPFMPAVNLNQWSGALPDVELFWLGFSRLAFSFLFSPPACSAGFHLLASTTSAVRTRASVVARFKLLSVGAGLQTW